ncbi:hypothetical protein FAZ69_11265 [Trinickia terrae]|uniref:Uncharacterized protein n=1 Tax=Trinickia terrae TaxID=2571161 RepID=A0A4V5PJ54_9BURK|nr:DUF6726 family protein [Trinickia terrae]TKC89500.1 hypothetical protein FAZ69_11265 [Trinickia terrae]
MRNSKLIRRSLRAAAWLALGVTLSQLAGCGLLAFPCRLTSAVVDIVPGVGHAAATPFDACAKAID